MWGKVEKRGNALIQLLGAEWERKVNNDIRIWEGSGGKCIIQKFQQVLSFPTFNFHLLANTSVFQRLYDSTENLSTCVFSRTKRHTLDFRLEADTMLKLWSRIAVGCTITCQLSLDNGYIYLLRTIDDWGHTGKRQIE